MSSFFSCSKGSPETVRKPKFLEKPKTSSFCPEPEESIKLPSKLENFMNGMIFMPPVCNPDAYHAFNNQYTKHLMIVDKENDQAKISVIVSLPKITPTKYIVFSHGNAMDITQLTDVAYCLKERFGVGVVLYDYFGYGLSTSGNHQDNKPSEKKCYKSLDIVVDYVKENLKVKDENIILMAHSLGTGVAVHYAWEKKWKTPIILFSPYKSIAKVVVNSSISRPVDKFRTFAKIPDLNCKVKIWHGEVDGVINVSHGKELAKLLPNNIKLEPTWLPNVGHNDILAVVIAEDEYVQELWNNIHYH